MKLLLKGTLASTLAIGLLAITPVTNAAVVVGDLTLDDFDTPDLTTFNADLVYDYTAMCFDDGTKAGDGTQVGLCGTDNGLNGPSKVTYGGTVDTASSFGVLTIDGTSMAVDTGSGFEGVTGTFSLTANFTGDGLFDSTGSNVDVNGSSTSYAGPDFLTADLTDFGYQGDTGSLDLLFALTFTSGDFTANGTLGGLHVSNASALGSWTADWSASGVDVNTAVLAVVPVPAAIWLFGSGILALVGFNRRR